MANDFFKGLIFGSIAGGAYTLLKTPRSGEENREILLDYIDDTTLLVDDVTKSMNELKEAFSTLSNEGKALAEEFTQEVTVSIEDFTNQTEPRIRRIQEQTEKLSNDVEGLTQQVSSAQ